MLNRLAPLESNCAITFLNWKKVLICDRGCSSEKTVLISAALLNKKCSTHLSHLRWKKVHIFVALLKKNLSYLAHLYSSRIWAPFVTVVLGSTVATGAHLKKKVLTCPFLSEKKWSSHLALLRQSAHLRLFNWKKRAHLFCSTEKKCSTALLNFVQFWAEHSWVIEFMQCQKYNLLDLLEKLCSTTLLNYLAQLIRSAPACSSGKQVLIYLSHLEKFTHLGCSSKKSALLCCSPEKKCSSHLALLRKKMCSTLLLIWKKVLSHLAHQEISNCRHYGGGRDSGDRLVLISQIKSSQPSLILWKKRLTELAQLRNSAHLRLLNWKKVLNFLAHLKKAVIWKKLLI